MSQSKLEINSVAAASVAGHLKKQDNTMRFTHLLIGSMLVLAAPTAFAQDRSQGESACGRDASRICKKVINDGDMAILGCLKENRAKLRPVCVKHLQDNGQL